MNFKLGSIYSILSEKNGCDFLSEIDISHEIECVKMSKMSLFPSNCKSWVKSKEEEVQGLYHAVKLTATEYFQPSFFIIIFIRKSSSYSLSQFYFLGSFI